MRPFDPRTIFLAKHAQHIVLIHFPVALFTIGVVFDAIARWRKSHELITAAQYNFLAAALSAPIAVLTGFLAWRWQLEGQQFRGILLWHAAGALISTVLIWAVWWIHRRELRAPQMRQHGVLAVQIITLAFIGATAHLGGFLSGVNGP